MLFSVGKIAAIIGLLVAFGVPQANITNVQAILEGQVSGQTTSTTPLLGNATKTVDNQTNEPVVTIDLRIAPTTVLKDFPVFQQQLKDGNLIQPVGDKLWVFVSGDWDKASLSLWDPEGILRTGTGINPPSVCNYGDNCFDGQHKGESGIFYDIAKQAGTWKWEVKAVKNGVEVTKTGTYAVE